MISLSVAGLRPVRRSLLLLSICLVVALVACLSPVTNANADPHFSLIVSQSLLEEQTLKLDAYRQSHPQIFERFYWQLIEIDRHVYYNYPLAPSIVALPAVGAARLAGLDMLVADQNYYVQNVLSALSCAFILLLVFLIARSYLPYWPALFISLISTLGSALFSTVATAYWNLDVAVIFVLLGLLLLARYDAGKTADAHPYLLGVFLFGAYFTRPSAAIFIVTVFLYLFFRDRRALVRCASLALAGFLVFIAFSRLQYDLWLPLYYTPSQWFQPQNLLRALYGVTFSPSRGLFIFSPFFLLAPLGGALYARRLRHKLLFWVCALWLCLHLFSVALTPQWHGGFSFGPRLLTDALPALILMTIIAWREFVPFMTRRRRQLVVATYLLLGLFGLFVNAIQGPFNVKATMWNAFPSVDTYPELLFDWRYPQFLTTTRTFHERRLSFFETRIASQKLQMVPYEWGSTLTPALQVTHAFWHGWWPDRDGNWWAETPLSSVILPISEVNPRKRYVLEIDASAAQPRRTFVSVNGRQVGAFTFGPAPKRASFIFDGSLLDMHNTVRIVMTVPVLYQMPRWTALGHTFSYNPNELGIRNAAVRLALLPEN